MNTIAMIGVIHATMIAVDEETIAAADEEEEDIMIKAVIIMGLVEEDVGKSSHIYVWYRIYGCRMSSDSWNYC